MERLPGMNGMHGFHARPAFVRPRGALIDGMLGGIVGILGALPGFLAGMAWFVVPRVMLFGLDAGTVVICVFVGAIIGVFGAALGAVIGVPVGVVVFVAKGRPRHALRKRDDERWWFIAAAAWLVMFVPAGWALGTWIDGGLAAFSGIGAC
jgi:hypothetical protein